MDPIKYISKTINLNIHGFDFAPTYWQAALIVFLLFLLVFTLARVRYLYVHWSLGKGSLAFLVWGFILATVVEGFLLLGGRTLFTEVIGWQNAPKPIGTALDLGRERLVNVLGVTSQIPESRADEPVSVEEIINFYDNLGDGDKESIRGIICTP